MALPIRGMPIGDLFFDCCVYHLPVGGMDHPGRSVRTDFQPLNSANRERACECLAREAERPTAFRSLVHCGKSDTPDVLRIAVRVIGSDLFNPLDYSDSE